MTGTRSRSIWAPAAALLAAAGAVLLLAAAAEAAGAKRVEDPRFDTAYLSDHGRVDITEATARRRLGAVRHTVTMRARVRPARVREAPSITINTRGGRRSPYELIVFRSTVFRVKANGGRKAVADATVTAKRRTWRYSFDLADVPGLGAGYGWAAVTQKRGGSFADVAPDGGYAKSP